MLAIRSVVLKLTILILLLPGCKIQDEKLTREEAMEFAGKMEKAITKGDPGFLDNAFSEKEFSKRVALENSDDANNFVRAALAKFKIGSQLTAMLTDKDDFSLVKYYEKKGKPHLIFRVYLHTSKSLNYHDYELLKQNGELKIADVYIYLSGELLSETCKNLYTTLQNHAESNNSSFTKADMPEVNELPEIKKLFMSGKYTEAKAKLDNLPVYLRKAKTILLMNIQVCSGIDTDHFSKSIEEYVTAYPTAENINFIMIDGYFIQKDYDKVLTAVNKLDSQINKDPFLDYFRYLAYYSLKRNADAKKCIQRLTKAMPEFEDGFIEMFGICLQDGEKEQADSVKAIYRTKRKFNQERLQNLEALYR